MATGLSSLSRYTCTKEYSDQTIKIQRALGLVLCVLKVNTLQRTWSIAARGEWQGESESLLSRVVCRSFSRSMQSGTRKVARPTSWPPTGSTTQRRARSCAASSSNIACCFSDLSESPSRAKTSIACTLMSKAPWPVKKASKPISASPRSPEPP